jgi:CRP-like cAMP-binding protein
MSQPPASERQNRILASLSKANLAGLHPHLEHTILAQGTVLYQVGATIQHVYFPRTALISLVGLTVQGQGIEVGMIGNEGFLGVPVIFGARTQQYAATVQITGSAEKVGIHVLDEKDGKTPFSDVLRRYAMIQLGQISQSAICNRFHSLTQRLIRWLLTAADRVGTPRLELTQEYLSQMIGAQRPPVATVVNRLEKNGLITCTRGSVVLVQREELEAAACECYGRVRNDIEAFLRGPDFTNRPSVNGGLL